MHTVAAKFYLSGGGDGHQSFPLDKFFLSKFPKNSHFLYVPIALKRHKLYPDVRSWMNGVLALHQRNDLSFDIAQDLEKYSQLGKYAFIYIGGGNTWDLMSEVKETGFVTRLLEYCANGGIVYGGSAGAIILGKYICTYDDENIVGLKDPSGLDILNNYSVTCHYQDSQQERFANWATEYQSPILCIPEESGIATDGRLGQCVGTHPCAIFFPNKDKTYIKPGEDFKM